LAVQIHYYQIFLLLTYIIINTIVIPLILILIFKRGILLRNKEDRTLAYIFLIPTYIFVYIFMKKFQMPAVVLQLLLVTLLALILLILLNRFQKISLHAMSASIALVFFIQINLIYPGYFVYFTIFLSVWAGFMGTSRLLLQAHDLREVCYGYLLGVLSSGFIYIF
jgi:hypothetical protein